MYGHSSHTQWKCSKAHSIFCNVIEDAELGIGSILCYTVEQNDRLMMDPSLSSFSSEPVLEPLLQEILKGNLKYHRSI